MFRFAPLFAVVVALSLPSVILAEAPTPAAPKPAAAPKAEAKTYTVRRGDTLWDIAERSLGDGARYREIARLNGIANPSRINVGAVLKLPS